MEEHGRGRSLGEVGTKEEKDNRTRRPSWRGSHIPLHPLVTEFKVQICVPPSLTACGVSTRDNLCTASATQNRSF